MAVVEVRPFIMRNAIVTFGSPGDDFAKAVSSAVLTPSTGSSEFKGLKPSAVFTFPQATLYALDLSYAQDWSSENSLSRYLWDHKGEQVPFTVNPDDQTGVTPAVGSTSWSGTVALTSGGIGGDVDSVATTTVSLGVIGEPELTFTAPVVADAESVDDDFPADRGVLDEQSAEVAPSRNS